jgi:CheY-like chemotaxis protein
MMAKLPDERYSSMTEVVKALETVWVPGSELAATLIRPPSSIPHTPLPLPPSPRGRTVLLVEPSRTQAVIVRKYLQDLGIADVQSCSSGQKALEMIRSSPPDIVISAMHLADTTGVELARRLSTEPNLASVGFVLVASETDANEASALRVIPNTVFLPKPFDLTGLEKAIGAARKG